MSHTPPAYGFCSDAELDDALARLNPPTSDPDLAAIKQRLLAQIAADSAVESRSAGRRFGRPRRVRAVVAACAVAAAAAALVASQVVAIGHRPPTATARAEVAVLLDGAAAKLASQRLVLPAGGYLHVRTHGWSSSFSDGPGGPYAVAREIVTDLYVPADDTGPWVQRTTPTGQLRWTHGSAELAAANHVDLGLATGATEQRAVCGAFGGDVPAGPSGGSSVASPAVPSASVSAMVGDRGPADPCGGGSFSHPTPTFLAGLPRDPGALWTRLRSEAYQTKWGDDSVFLEVSDTLRSGLVPPDLAAALFRTLAAHLPDLNISDHNTDLDGRVGTAISLLRPEVNPLRQDIIIDMTTGQYLGGREVFVVDDPTGDGRPGDVVGQTSVTTDVVPSLP